MIQELSFVLGSSFKFWGIMYTPYVTESKLFRVLWIQKSDSARDVLLTEQCLGGEGSEVVAPESASGLRAELRGAATSG